MRSEVMRRLVGAAVLPALVTISIIAGPPAPAAAQATPTLGEVAISGLHNSFQRTAFARFADALATGTGLVEIDVWTTFGAWTVGHDHPFFGDNNCASAGGAVNRDLRGCVDNIAAWHRANPSHWPLLVKVELKAGFQNDQGVGPDELDAVFASRLGSAMYRPADLMRGIHATPDAAARANAWGGTDALRGRVALLVLKGTVENDPLPTDVEYSRHLRANPQTAVGFPIVHGGFAAADPRSRYEAALRPWFVVFDGAATTFAGLPAAARAFYSGNRYLAIATDSHAVAPALSRTNPTTTQASDRLRQLGCLGASVASSDWYTVPGWHLAVPRGC